MIILEKGGKKTIRLYFVKLYRLPFLYCFDIMVVFFPHVPWVQMKYNNKFEYETVSGSVIYRHYLVQNILGVKLSENQ